MFLFWKTRRSVSLPEICDEESTENQRGTRYGKSERRRARSLSRISDQSNSAAPLRRQPHPFAMHAFGMRGAFPGVGRGNRLPEWPPPDPPPLTPINFFAPNFATANAAPMPPRPWWRRNGPARPASPVVHVTIDTTDTINPLPLRIPERPTRIGSADPTEDNNDREPMRVTPVETATTAVTQQSSLIHTDEGNSSTLANTITIERDEIRPTRAQIVIHQGSVEDTVAEVTSNIQAPNEQPELVTATLSTEDVGMVSVSSEPIQEDNVYQVLVVVLDSNPTMRNEPYQTAVPSLGFTMTPYEYIRRRFGEQYEAESDVDESNPD